MTQRSSPSDDASIIYTKNVNELCSESEKTIKKEEIKRLGNREKKPLKMWRDCI